MKKFLAFLLSLTMVFAMAAVAFAEGETYLWDNFDDRDPNAKPELAPNGVHLWWDNWANLRAKNEDGALKLDMRPKAYDPEDYDSEDDYYAHAADWMANWGEAVDMWGFGRRLLLQVSDHPHQGRGRRRREQAHHGLASGRRQVLRGALL